MKKIVVGLIIFLVVGCKAKQSNFHLEVSDQLAKVLNNNIDYNDSIAKVNNAKPYNSYWIVFSTRKPWSISIEPYYDYYELDRMDGYFYYKNKIISVYNLNKAFSRKFVNKKLLQKSGIKKLSHKFSDEIANDLWRLYAVENDSLRFLPKS